MKNNQSFNKFLVIWTGELISSIGSGLTAFALAVYVYKMTGTATSVSLVMLCSFLPMVILSPLAGVLADRFDRRLLMIIGDSISALGLVYILVVMLSGNIQLWQILIGVSISSTFIALLEPSYKATITDLLTEEQYSKASGLVQVASASKYLFSPIIAGYLLIYTNIKTIIIIDIVTFVITVLTVIFIKKRLPDFKEKPNNKNYIKDLKEGWEAITEKKGIIHLIVTISVVTFFIGFIQTLIAPMMLSIVDVKVLGIIQSFSAIGLLVSSIFISIILTSIKERTKLILGLGFAGVFMALLGLTINIYFIIFAIFLLFGSLPYINTGAEVLIRKNIDNEKQGRAWGIIGIISQLGYIVAYCISGILADNIFNPLLVKNGILASSVGRIIGVGQNRGIGLLFIISGILVFIISIIISRTKNINDLEVI